MFFLAGCLAFRIAVVTFYKVYIAYLVPSSILVPIIILLQQYKKLTVIYKILLGYLFLSACINAAGIIIGLMHYSNLWLFHIDTIVESVLLLFFFKELQSDTLSRRIITFITYFFPLACIVNLVLFQAASKINTYPRAIESILFIFLSINYWFKEYNSEENITWAEHPVNWVLGGILLYFSSSFCLFVFSNFLLTDALAHRDFNLLRIIWSVHATLLLIMYIFFSIGFYKLKKQHA